MPGKGKRSDSVGALLLGVYDRDGQLRYVGRVGSGFSDSELQRLSGLLAPLARPASPFTAGEQPPRGARFCEPRLVVEVAFANWTAGGSLRAPVYKGLREDKPPEQVVREDIADAGADAPADDAQQRATPRRQAAGDAGASRRGRHRRTRRERRSGRCRYAGAAPKRRRRRSRGAS